jgi:hypothetical protein
VKLTFLDLASFLSLALGLYGIVIALLWHYDMCTPQIRVKVEVRFDEESIGAMQRFAKLGDFKIRYHEQIAIAD